MKGFERVERSWHWVSTLPPTIAHPIFLLLSLSLVLLTFAPPPEQTNFLSFSSFVQVGSFLIERLKKNIVVGEEGRGWQWQCLVPLTRIVRRLVFERGKIWSWQKFSLLVEIRRKFFRWKGFKRSSRGERSRITLEARNLSGKHGVRV